MKLLADMRISKGPIVTVDRKTGKDLGLTSHLGDTLLIGLNKWPWVQANILC